MASKTTFGLCTIRSRCRVEKNAHIPKSIAWISTWWCLWWPTFKSWGSLFQEQTDSTTYIYTLILRSWFSPVNRSWKYPLCSPACLPSHMPVNKLDSQASSLGLGEDVINKQQVKTEMDTKDVDMIQELEEHLVLKSNLPTTIPFWNLKTNLILGVGHHRMDNMLVTSFAP